MIAIVNMGQPENYREPVLSEQPPRQFRKYEVRINHRVICEFTHWREDGLATCLRKAADAVDAHNKPVETTGAN